MSEAAAKPKGYSYVRMSTDIQIKGDSLRRQLEQSRDFAEKNDLELVEGFSLQDIGISAFKGANISGGALGTFLEAVKAGKIEPGSYLLVESFDRLSRQEIMRSLAVFMDLVNAGINLVTLADGHVYRAGKTNMPELMYSIAVMSRAHEESLTKSYRVSSAWANKRKNLGHRKLTRLCPGWLTLSADKSSFEIDEVRAEVVRSIFGESAAGIGSYSIARRLNQAGVRPFGRSSGWQVSSVTKLLTGRAVLGEFQPNRLRNGKRVPEGEPIPGYFPQIVEPELFLRVQQSRDGRRVGGGGRRGPLVSNIFSGIATCGYCHSKMHFVNKGAPPKGGTYLVCDRARRGLGCDSTGWRYDDFEASFLAFVQELDLEALLHAGEDNNKRAALSRKIAALEGERAEFVRRRDRTYELIVDQANTTDFIRTKLDEAETSVGRVDEELSAKKAELQSLERDAGRVYRSKDEIKSLIERLQNKTDADVYALRATIAARLRVLVPSTEVFVKGTRPLTLAAASTLGDLTVFGADEGDRDFRQRVVTHMEDSSHEARESRPLFSVAFRDGRVRIIFPDSTDPLSFEE